MGDIVDVRTRRERCYIKLVRNSNQIIAINTNIHTHIHKLRNSILLRGRCVGECKCYKPVKMANLLLN